MALDKQTTLNDFLLRSLNQQEKIDFLFEMGIIEDIESHILKNLLIEHLEKYLSGLIKKNLKEKTGKRMTILRDLFSTTFFHQNLDYLTRFGNKECSGKEEKHLFLISHTERDVYESDNYYYCLFCGKKDGGRSFGKKCISNMHNAYDEFKKAYMLLANIVNQNPNDEEIRAFVKKLIEITGGIISSSLCRRGFFGLYSKFVLVLAGHSRPTLFTISIVIYPNNSEV